MAEAIFDCTQVEAKCTQTVPSARDKDKLSRLLVQRLVSERERKGEATPEVVAVVNRNVDGDIRWFNLGDKVSNLIYGEALLGPIWRLATKEEELAEVERCKKARKEQAKRTLRYEQEAVTALASKAAFQRMSDIVNEEPESDEEVKDDKKKAK